MAMMNQEFDDNPQPKRQQMNTRTPQFTEQKHVEGTPSDVGSQMDLDSALEETEYKMEIDESAPEALPMRYLSTKKYSTTSSVYASDTIGAPDIRQILFCLGSVIQAQMVEDDECPPEIKALYPEFNQTPDLTPEYGGVVDVLPDAIVDSDAYDDEDLRWKLKNNIVPSVDTITRYISFLSMCIQLTPEVNIIALVYVNRLASNAQLVLTMANWRAVWLICIILAQKMWNDRPVKIGTISKFIPPMDKIMLRNLEARVLQLLEYSIGVKPSLYVKYYFELRQLFTTIMGFKLSEWRVKPLTVRNASRLDALCIRTKAKIQSNMSPMVKDADSVDMSALSKPVTPDGGERKDSGRKGERKAGVSSSFEDVTYTSQARFVIS